MDENGGNGKKREKNIFLFYNIKWKRCREYKKSSGCGNMQPEDLMYSEITLPMLSAPHNSA